MSKGTEVPGGDSPTWYRRCAYYQAIGCWSPEAGRAVHGMGRAGTCLGRRKASAVVLSRRFAGGRRLRQGEQRKGTQEISRRRA